MRTAALLGLLLAAAAASLAPLAAADAPQKKGKVVGGPKDAVRPEDIPYIKCQVRGRWKRAAPATHRHPRCRPPPSFTSLLHVLLHACGSCLQCNGWGAGVPAAVQECVASGQGDEESVHTCQPREPGSMHALWELPGRWPPPLLQEPHA